MEELPRVHFVFASHVDDKTAKVLMPVLKSLRGKISFIGVELSGVSTKRKKELEDRLRVGSGGDEHDRAISKLAREYSVPIKILEVARSRQRKKIARLGNKRFPKGFPNYLHEMSFETALKYQKDGVYKNFNRYMARHQEVIRNLKKELKANPTKTPVVTYGTFHKGLDKYAELKLGVKTERTCEEEPFTLIHEDIMEQMLSQGKAKLSIAHAARIALEDLLQLSPIARINREKYDANPMDENAARYYVKLNQIKDEISRKNATQIQLAWQKLRATSQKLGDTWQKRYENIDQAHELVKSI